MKHIMLSVMVHINLQRNHFLDTNASELSGLTYYVYNYKGCQHIAGPESEARSAGELQACSSMLVQPTRRLLHSL